MTLNELYSKLNKAYSDENLNNITRKLIELYKHKNYTAIREIANKISKFVSIDEDKDAKCFSKLVTLYHPDKGEAIRKLLDLNHDNQEELTRLSHILLITDFIDKVETVEDPGTEFKPEYAWDNEQSEGYSFIDSNDSDQKDFFNTDEVEKSFYNAIKLREYGQLDVEFPTYYLEDFEEFEMTYNGIEFLDGVEYCIHAKILDLSNNSIDDVSKLWDLDRLEELYLAYNHISYIDTLSNLLNLRVLDLSGNQIDDISPLFELPKLEFVNLIGNPVSGDQIKILTDKEIIVMS